MKKFIVASPIAMLLVVAGLSFFAKQQSGYILEHEKDIAVEEPGSHNGGGNTTAYKFFKSATTSKLQFTKRTLHPGSGIGYHLQKEEEIYYIVSGTGEMSMNPASGGTGIETFAVQTGDGILTLPGSSHGLKQTGKEDLVVIINYGK